MALVAADAAFTLLLHFPLVDCLLIYSNHWLLPNNALHCCCLLSPLVNCSLLLPSSLVLVCCRGGCHHSLCHDSGCTTTVPQRCCNIAEQQQFLPMLLHHYPVATIHCVTVLPLPSFTSFLALAVTMATGWLSLLKRPQPLSSPLPPNYLAERQ